MDNQSDKVSFDRDMLGVISWLARVGTDSVWLLRNIADQIKEGEISEHCAFTAFDCLSYEKRVLFCAYIAGKKTLSKDENRYFRDIGFLYEANPVVPKAIRERAEFYNKYCYNEMK